MAATENDGSFSLADAFSLCAKNSDIAYAWRNVALITYEPRHVDTYHKWMSDPEVRAETCSEELTLEGEHETRNEWATHALKGTFLIMDLEKYYSSNGAEAESLVGDVNFVQYPEYIEIMVMIGDRAARRKGLGSTAVRLMIAHAIQILNDGKCPLNNPKAPRRLKIFINEDNVKSINLFEKLGFQKTETRSVFGDVEMFLPSAEYSPFQQLLNRNDIYINQNLVDQLLLRSHNVQI